MLVTRGALVKSLPRPALLDAGQRCSNRCCRWNPRRSRCSPRNDSRGVALAAGRSRELALTAIDQAVQIRQRLVKASPEAFLPDLAVSLNNHSLRLAGLGRREQALTAIDQAVQIRRRLAEASPDAFLPDLAVSLTALGIRLTELGRYRDALATNRQVVKVYLRPCDGSRTIREGCAGRHYQRRGRHA
jgi:tetratricopeptide (TPR) repeat protein